jgi:cytochrome c
VPQTNPRLRVGLAWAAAATLLELAAGAAAQSVPDAKDAQVLSDKYFCSACHANDRTMVGPGFKQIADKYRGDVPASAALAEKVKKGGQGVWGSVPMPPNPTISDDELKRVLAWILSL